MSAKRRRPSITTYQYMTAGRSEEKAKAMFGEPPSIPAGHHLAESPSPRWAPTRDKVRRGTPCSICGKPITSTARGEVWRERRSGDVAHRSCARAAQGRADAADAL